MKAALTFGLGVFVCAIVISQTEHLIRAHELAPIFPGLPGFFICFIMGWFFYTIGAAVFKRNVSALVAFSLGVVAMLIERASIANFLAHTTLDLDSRDALNNSPSGDLVSACAQLFLPIAVIAFLTPVLGRRKN
ncbi:MAG: hypothetical protein ABJB01_00265 [Rudaea sp.]